MREGGKRFKFSPKSLETLWGLTSLLLIRYWKLFPLRVSWPGHDADNSNLVLIVRMSAATPPNPYKVF
jgi:hypothetical protein